MQLSLQSDDRCRLTGRARNSDVENSLIKSDSRPFPDMVPHPLRADDNQLRGLSGVILVHRTRPIFCVTGRSPDPRFASCRNTRSPNFGEQSISREDLFPSLMKNLQQVQFPCSKTFPNVAPRQNECLGSIRDSPILNVEEIDGIPDARRRSALMRATSSLTPNGLVR